MKFNYGDRVRVKGFYAKAFPKGGIIDHPLESREEYFVIKYCNFIDIFLFPFRSYKMEIIKEKDLELWEGSK